MIRIKWSLLAIPLLLLLPAAFTGSEATGDVFEIVFETDDQIKYQIEQFEVKAGQTVRLTIRKTGVMPKAAMAHNVVILKQGVSVEEFSVKSILAADNEYIPKDSPDIIAHTKLVGNGEEDTIEFTAPPPGIYTYVCAFPGHYMVMQGKMIVK